MQGGSIKTKIDEESLFSEAEVTNEEIVKRILEEEKKVALKEEKAREEAENIIKSAKEEAQQQIKKAREEARKKAKARKEKINREVKKEIASIEKEFADKEKALDNAKKARSNNAISVVINIVMEI